MSIKMRINKILPDIQKKPSFINYRRIFSRSHLSNDNLENDNLEK